MEWWPDRSPPRAEKGTPKTWDEWTDVLGQTYRPGDYVAVAVINGKSPQMVIGKVVQINRVDSKGQEHRQQRSYYVPCEEDDRGARENWPHSDVPNEHRYIRTAYEYRPSCTVRVQPSIDTRDFWRSKDAKAVTYSIWENIIKVDAKMIKAKEKAIATDLEALREELA